MKKRKYVLNLWNGKELIFYTVNKNFGQLENLPKFQLDNNCCVMSFCSKETAKEYKFFLEKGFNDYWSVMQSDAQIFKKFLREKGVYPTINNR